MVVGGGDTLPPGFGSVVSVQQLLCIPNFWYKSATSILIGQTKHTRPLNFLLCSFLSLTHTHRDPGHVNSQGKNMPARLEGCAVDRGCTVVTTRGGWWRRGENTHREVGGALLPQVHLPQGSHDILRLVTEKIGRYTYKLSQRTAKIRVHTRCVCVRKRKTSKLSLKAVYSLYRLHARRSKMSNIVT